MIVVDASVLIAQIDASDVHHARADGLLRQVAGTPLAASTVTIAEVLVRPIQTNQLEQGEVALRRLSIAERPVPLGAALRLASLRATTGLKLPDCCVLLAAQELEPGSIATFDDRLAAAARELGIAVAED